MPYSPGTRCSDPSCGELATHHGKCDKHKRKAWANPSQHTRQMDPTREREWRKQVRDKSHGRCVQCGAPGAIADHILTIAEGGALYDPTNGQWLCTACDQTKTKADLARMAANRKISNRAKPKRA